ncbi:hypothetical protein ANN_24800 [Periplaneta americana]|uniref:Uncharacterized protein n=1 Tax=Periplaneta americana TaxID=6978 RepID=A0ABQ8RZL9_PERAM|nr:hypothetical protein ANN_24800 [Periplaneta americana]
MPKHTVFLVSHYFPVRGHLFPSDCDFGSIKRLLRRADQIYTPEYTQIMANVSRISRFSVHQVSTDEILSFKDWWPSSYKKMTNSDETSGRDIPKDIGLQWSNCRKVVN